MDYVPTMPNLRVTPTKKGNNEFRDFWFRYLVN